MGVHEIVRSDVDRLPSANGTITRLAYARAQEAGVKLDPLLSEAGLSRFQIENPHVRLKVRDQILFLNLVAEALEDEFLGFHLARVPDLREFGLLYYVLASAETVLDTFQRGVRYSSIVNEGISLSLAQTGHLVLSLRYVGVHRHPDRHQIEFCLASIIRICRQLTGRHILPTHVQLVHNRKSYGPEFREFFGDDIRFGAATDELAFPLKLGRLPVLSSDPYLNSLLVTYCEETLSERARKLGSFRSTVENTVVPLLPHGKATASEIARRLGVGQRTFARRLSSEGLTFSDLLVKLRFDLAKRYLADRDLSISQIAWLLGYKEVCSFSHAFKRWTGTTPRETRGTAEVV